MQIHQRCCGVPCWRLRSPVFKVVYAAHVGGRTAVVLNSASASTSVRLGYNW